MPTRGRKPKPVAQKIREGNPGNRPLPEPLSLKPGAPAKPAGLPPEASELWDEVVPMLDAAGVLHTIDRAALQAMCLEWQFYCDGVAAVEQESPFGLGSMGQVVEHPALGSARNSALLFLRFAEQFGLTPSSRVRIVALANSAPGIDLDSILDAPPALVAMPIGEDLSGDG